MWKLISSYISSSVATWIVAFLMPLFVLEITKSAMMVSITYAISFLPFILITPFAGVIGDKFNRKKLMIILDVVSIVLVFIISQSTFSRDNLIILLCLIFLVSSIGACHHPIFQSMVNTVVMPEKIKNFNSYTSTADNIISFAAPAAIGILIAVLSIRQLMYIVLIGYVLSLSCLIFIHYKTNYLTSNIQNKSIFNLLKEGFVYVYNNQIIRYTCILFFIVNFGIRIVYTNLIYHFNVDFNANSTMISYLFAVMGVGAVIGSLTAPKIIGCAHDISIILLATFLIGIMSLLLSFSNTGVSSAIIWGISSAVQSVIVVTFFTLRQKMVPSEIIGRVVGVTRLVAFASIPLSAITGGFIMEYANNFKVISIFSAVVVIGAAIIFFGIFSRLIKSETQLIN
jgi:DHA3 family macrolide efflux protein-like MFS transporter